MYRLVAIGVLLSLAMPGWAFQVNFSAGATATHTDNSRKTASNEASDLETSIDARLGANHSGPSVNLNANYDVSKITYKSDTQDENTVTNGSAKVAYEQIPQTLFWTLENVTRSTVVDKSLVNIQNNRDQQSNTRASGRYVIQLTGVDSLSLGVNYSDVNYKNSTQQETSRLGGNIVLNHQLSQVDNIFLALTYDDVSVQDRRNDYDYRAAGIGYDVTLAKLSYSLAAGYDEIVRGNDVNQGTRVDVSVDYRGGVSNLSVKAGQRLTDTSAVNFLLSPTTLNQTSNSQTFDVLQITSFEVDYGWAGLCGSCSTSLGLLYEEERYKILPDDNDQTVVNLGFGYSLSQLTSLSLNGEYREFRFVGDNAREDYEQVSYSVGLGRNLSQRLSIQASVAYEERTSTSKTTVYDELRGGISLRYTFL